MELEIIIECLEKLRSARLYRTPKDIKILLEPWFEQFETISSNQFRFAISEIISKETTWPAIATIYRYAENWQIGYKEKTCPYCDGTGFLLIKSRGKDIAFACKCSTGKLRQRNLQIASYESLGIPWPEVNEKINYSRKMSKENRKRIDQFLGRIGEEMEGESG